MASIEVLNATQANVEAPVEIQLSLGNPTYRGPAGKDGKPGENGYTPIKGVDYFTEADIQNIIEQVTPSEIDLSDYAHKNEIPTKISDLTNDEGFISSYTETDPTVPAWAKQPDKPTYTASEVGALSADTVIPTVPTNVSDFVNDAGYLTEHQSLNDYATKSYVEQIVAGIETGLLKRAVVSTLPSTGIDENTIYMVERTNSETNNVYDEYLYLNNNWEKIGSTEVDLTGYATEEYVNSHQLSATGSIKIEDNKIKSIFPYYKLFGLMSNVATGYYNNLAFENADYPTFPSTGWTLPQASTFEEMIVALKEYGIVECINISQPDGPSYYGPTLAQINAALGTNYTNIWCIDKGGQTGAQRRYTESTYTGIHTSCVLLATEGNYMIDFINGSFYIWFQVCIYDSINAPSFGFTNLSGEKLIDMFKSIDTNFTQRPATEYLTNTDVQNIWDGN